MQQVFHNKYTYYDYDIADIYCNRIANELLIARSRGNSNGVKKFESCLKLAIENRARITKILNEQWNIAVTDFVENGSCIDCE